MIRTHRRGGFTLVELLVGLSIFLTLAGLVLLLYPGARDQDRVRYSVADVTAHLRMAQSMAARDKAPRGIRFVVNSSVSAATPDPTNDLKKDPLWVTELQYIEQPAPLIPNRNPLSNSGSSYNPNSDPRVRFEYTVVAPPTGGNPVPNPPPGSIVASSRKCYIDNLDAGTQIPLIQRGCTLTLPTLGFWSKITNVAVSGSTVEVTLEVYPDALLGGSTHAQTYHFAVYLNSIPLVGEPTVPLPRNTCVDLNVSFPRTTSDFDVLFAPDGKMIGAPNGQIFLWMRDFTKAAPNNGTGWAADMDDALRRGGDQHIIVIRATGAIASNSVKWPAGLTYSPDTEPYQLARDQGR